MIKFLHSWKLTTEKAIELQEHLRKYIVLKKEFSELNSIGGADVSYSKDKDVLNGAMVVLSLPELKLIDKATARGKITFPYIPGLLSFREGPILIKTFQKWRIKPDLMIFDGQGIAHPRGIGLASHLGLWLDLPSIGCAKTSLFGEFKEPGPIRGDFEWIYHGKKKIGAILRTKDRVKPLFVSPGHRIDLALSVQIVLKCCKGFRFPEALRKAHQLSRQMIHCI